MTAFIAGLLVTGAAPYGASAERSPQTIPSPKTERAPSKNATASAANRGKPSGGAAGGWGTTLGGLIAVLAVIGLAAKVLRKSLPAAQRTLPNEVVHVLGRKPLDYRHSIHLIRCGSRLLVVGSSQEGLRTLCEMSDPVEIDYLSGLCKPSEPASVADSFSQLFRRFQGPAATESVIDPESPASSDPAVVRLQERLQQSQHDESDESNDDPHHSEPAGESAA